MGLIFTFHLQGRSDDLHIYGPKGLDEIITLQLKYSESVLHYPIHFHVISEGGEILFETEDLWIKSITLNHRIACFGFLFEEKPRKFKLIREALPATLTKENLQELKDGADIVDLEGKFWPNKVLANPPRLSRRYAYVSDTRYMPEFMEELVETDLLYHEATFLSDMQSRAESTYHSTAAEAGQFAKDHKVKELIIGHFSSRYYDVTPFLEEAKTIFPATKLAIEGQSYEIPINAATTKTENHVTISDSK